MENIITATNEMDNHTARTLEAKVLRKLKRSLSEAVHEAVRELANDPPSLPKGKHASDKERPSRRGVTRPLPGGLCDAVWAELDKIYARRKKAPPTLHEILEIGRKKGWNTNNTRVEYYCWRKYNGIEGRGPVR